jgi:hypothetical protein
VGDSVTFTLDDTTSGSGSQGQQRMRFAGRVTGDTMTGSVTTGGAGSAGPWRAARKATP